MLSFLEAILGSTLDFAPPIVLAALGGVVSERSGVVNLGLEGMMRFGAFFAAATTIATGDPWLGMLAGVASGAITGMLHGWLSIRWRSDQIVSGIAINLVALGAVTFLVETLFGRTQTDSYEAIGAVRIPAIEGVPLVRALSGHSWVAWIAVALPFLVHGLLYRTTAGLRIRAVGENPRAAATAGVAVNRLRYGCVVASGVLAGAGGAALTVSTLNQFNNTMPAGQGFIALAAVVFGKWTPLGAFGAALFFAAANALRISLGSSVPWVADAIPSGFLLALPYVLTLLLLAGFVGRARAPAADGVPFDPELR